MGTGKVIGNVNVLDIRHATEDSIAGIEKIGNVNIVVHTRETAPLVGRLRAGNLNATIEATAEARVQLFSGQTGAQPELLRGSAARQRPAAAWGKPSWNQTPTPPRWRRAGSCWWYWVNSSVLRTFWPPSRRGRA